MFHKNPIQAVLIHGRDLIIFRKQKTKHITLSNVKAVICSRLEVRIVTPIPQFNHKLLDESKISNKSY